MKLSKRTKKHDMSKVIKMIGRDEELQRNNGNWVAVNKVFKNKKKYDRKRDRKIDLDSPTSFFLFEEGKERGALDNDILPSSKTPRRKYNNYDKRN